MTAVQNELRRLEELAAADASGDAKAHGELLRGISVLQLAAETPLETTFRLNFQVRVQPPCSKLPLRVSCSELSPKRSSSKTSVFESQLRTTGCT